MPVWVQQYKRLARNKDEKRIIWAPCSCLYSIFKGANSLKLNEELINMSTCDMNRLDLACGSGSSGFIDKMSPPRMTTTSDSSPTTLLRETT
jgi:hypothetical protein